MIKNIAKRISILPVILAGILFFSGFCTVGKKAVAKVEDIDVSKTDYFEAVHLVNESVKNKLLNKNINIVFKDYEKEYHYTLTYPQISFCSDVYEKVALAQKKGGNHSLNVTYFVNGLDDFCNTVGVTHGKAVVQPSVNFMPNCTKKFEYLEGSDGCICDTQKLKADINNAINSDSDATTIEVSYITVKPDIQRAELEIGTAFLSNCTTNFYLGLQERTHNISLASEKINGTILNEGEEFSFNKIVGVRSGERGFKKAKIIVGGKYVEGYGGGVCQVSTTLYNTALLAGLTVTEYHSHSLRISYIEPSFDAMVNGSSCDLKFINNTKGKVYICALVKDNALSVSMYGYKGEYEISKKSVITELVAPPESRVCVGEEDLVLQQAKEGVRSKGYLEYRKDNLLISRKLIRSDYYAPTQGIIQKKFKNY